MSLVHLLQVIKMVDSRMHHWWRASLEIWVRHSVATRPRLVLLLVGMRLVVLLLDLLLAGRSGGVWGEIWLHLLLVLPGLGFLLLILLFGSHCVRDILFIKKLYTRTLINQYISPVKSTC